MADTWLELDEEAWLGLAVQLGADDFLWRHEIHFDAEGFPLDARGLRAWVTFESGMNLVGFSGPQGMWEWFVSPEEANEFREGQGDLLRWLEDRVDLNADQRKLAAAIRAAVGEEGALAAVGAYGREVARYAGIRLEALELGEERIPMVALEEPSAREALQGVRARPCADPGQRLFATLKPVVGQPVS